MENVAHALALAGCSFGDVVKTTVWLEDARDFGEFNRVYSEFFSGKKAGALDITRGNMVGTKIEIEVVAFKP